MIRFKLSVMMFLEFFVWGAWFPLIFGYLATPSLGFSGTQQAWILGTFNLAAFTAMFFSTQFADRNFAAEKFLAFSQLVGGVAILALFWVKGGQNVTLFGLEIDLSFWAFFVLLLVHSLFYVPTISITNSIAFANLKDPQHEFGPVRLWGTIGWIAASVPMTFALVDWVAVERIAPEGFFNWLGTVLGTSKTGEALREATSYIFVAAGGASLLLAVFCLSVPRTPPRRVDHATGRVGWVAVREM